MENYLFSIDCSNLYTDMIKGQGTYHYYYFCHVTICIFLCMMSLSNYSLFLFSCREITLILCDSRGASILPYLTDPGVICKVYRGARISDVALRASKLIRDLNPRVCLILAGINDFTVRNKKDRVTRIHVADSFDLANLVIRRLLSARRLLTRKYPDTKIAFGGINGIQLNRYNHMPGVSRNQSAIDDAIMQVNMYIRLLNQQMGVYHPRLISKVHVWYKGKRKNNYHLLSDGLHLGAIVTRYWVRSLMRFHRVNTLGHEPTWICRSSPRR